MMQNQVLTVSQVNEYIKAQMERDELLTFLCVSGEISNYKLYPSGHHYFSLKDAGGALRCVMFRGSAAKLRFRPENGMKVLAFGRVSVFPRDGAYQLYCEQMTPTGTGDLFAAFEQLKKKLQSEGLFEQFHKKPIPQYPQRIAVITSSAGAALHDMLRILNARYPLAKVILLPVRVQGAEAPAELCGAIRYANSHHIADVMIIGRGGGSMEDLWAFNDEKLAYTIFESEIPVISAVGHEPDVTISDYVADLRAATPSNAAELVVPDQADLRERIHSVLVRMGQSMSRKIKINRQRVEALKNTRCLKSPYGYVEERRLLLDHKQKELNSIMKQSLLGNKHAYIRLTTALNSMSPLNVLSRGYSVTKTERGVLTNATDVQLGETVSIQLHKGSISAQVVGIGGKDE